MANSPESQPAVVLDFLRLTLPFSGLDDSILTDLARQCLIDFMPSGTRVLTKGVSEPDHLLMVQRGGVKLSIMGEDGEDGEETLLDYRGEGGFVGELALIQKAPASMDAYTVEDTFFIRLPGVAFQHLIKTQPLVAEYFLRAFSDNYLSKAFSEMVERRVSLTCDSGLYLFSSEVGEMITRAPVMVPYGETIQLSALKMSQNSVGSLLVHDPSGEVVGIVTDKDLRGAIALGMDYSAPIETIMSTPVATVESQTVVFDALLQMMTKQIHHLAVTRRGSGKSGDIIGVVTSHDIMVLQGRSPMSIFREIMTTDTLVGLHPLSGKVPMVVRTLVEEGAKAGNITRMITVLNDLILEKLLDLVMKQLGPAPLPFAWLLMGSEGRREQTFATDQDNALVYKDTDDDILKRACDIYFTHLTEMTNEHLVKCGFPACEGNIMASNPELRQPFAKWHKQFEHWIMVPEPEEVLKATIFFDFRLGYGDESFVRELRNHVIKHAPRQEVFLRHLAQDCLGTRPPLSFFKSFVVEKTGEHKNRLDIKKRGLVPFADFARVLALKHGIKETNTLSRLKLLGEGGFIPQELYSDTAEAFEFLLQLRLVHQLALVEQGEKPDNHIDPARLSDIEKQTLKEAFAVIGRMQTYLRDMFRLNIA